jgi:DNA-binding LacI/PurR family transcriptional regulator
VVSISYQQGYHLLFLPYSPLNKHSRKQLFDLVTQNSMDGLISTPPCDTDDFIQDLISTFTTPLVQIDPLLDANFPTVSGSHASGAREITQHLLSLGHRRIAFLGGPAELRSSAERLAGYRLALHEKGLPLDPELVEKADFTFDGGVQATHRIFSRPNPPTAVFGGNDFSALGALYALQELGFRVPGQVSVCGFDDLPQSGLVFPGLSTVHQPADELLEAAVLLLIGLLNKDPEAEQKRSLPTRLMLRGSIARPPEG